MSQPFSTEQKKTMLDHAQKTFPDRCPFGLEAELDEYESLLSARFNTESGALPAAQQARLAALTLQFTPQP